MLHWFRFLKKSLFARDVMLKSAWVSPAPQGVSSQNSDSSRCAMEPPSINGWELGPHDLGNHQYMNSMKKMFKMFKINVNSPEVIRFPTVNSPKLLGSFDNLDDVWRDWTLLVSPWGCNSICFCSQQLIFSVWKGSCVTSGWRRDTHREAMVAGHVVTQTMKWVRVEPCRLSVWVGKNG